MRIIAGLVVTFASALVSHESWAQDRGSISKRMPVYVTPLYNSDGPVIKVGTFSDELTKATAKTIKPLTDKMKREWRTLPAETMYVTAIRLYDFGLKDDATYWFYSAQYRWRLLGSIVPPEAIGGLGTPEFETIQANNAFFQLAGPYISGYAFGNLPKLTEIIEKIIKENEQIPEFEKIYPNMKLLPASQWPEKNKEIADGLRKLVDHIAKNGDQIKAQRKQNGIEGKY
jgi:hypothetical protein